MNLFKKKLVEPFRSQKIYKEKFSQYTIGKGTYGVPEIYDWNEGSTLKIGAYCSISSNVKIYLGGHHRSDWISTYPFPAFIEKAKNIKNYGGTNGNVTIGNDVWICANVIILSGVTIGDGAVIANGSVVTKNVAAYEIVGGNPATHIKYRFEENLKQKLLRINWWDWSEKEIESIVHIFCSQDINALLQYAKEREE